ncbi:lysophospholipid acyltransferase family protein [Chamaesiphon sp. OTE_20_metabat_361]|uniref:lysophospholipid acyltransferase family protein n=1 Tax=Chamaesiphon sp. OTE_20_metabat_361 TaxID=2964689 RepID=UPI0037BF3F6E
MINFFEQLVNAPAPDRHKYDGWSLDDRDPRVIREVFMPVWKWLYEYYFRVVSDGWEHVPAQGRMLVVGSHNGGLAAPDMFMLMYDWFVRYGTERPAYGLAHPDVWKYFGGMSTLAVRAGAMRAHPKMALAALQKEAVVLVYPGGAEDVFRPHSQRDRIQLAGRKGFIKVALRENAPIVPVVSTGAHDGLIVLSDIYPLLERLHERGMPWLFGIDPNVFPIYLGLPWGIAFGPLPNLPLPTQVHIRICEPIEFDRYGRNAASDRDYVDACYDRVESQMQAELDRLLREKS